MADVNNLHFIVESVDVPAKQEMKPRQSSIRKIAHELQFNDQGQASMLEAQRRNRFDVRVTTGSEAEYLEEAERLLDFEMVKMAEERIMARLRGNMP